MVRIIGDVPQMWTAGRMLHEERVAYQNVLMMRLPKDSEAMHRRWHNEYVHAAQRLGLCTLEAPLSEICAR